jgi:ABC-type ATPase involved in cell division
MIRLDLHNVEVNVDKTKYMFMTGDQNAGRSHSMKIDNSYIERVEEFKYLVTTLTDQNCIQVEINRRLKLGNACYYSVQNLLSSRLLTYSMEQSPS